MNTTTLVAKYLKEEKECNDIAEKSRNEYEGTIIYGKELEEAEKTLNDTFDSLSDLVGESKAYELIERS